MSSVVVIGPGRAGLSLAVALAGSGAYREVALCGRHPQPPDHPAAAHPRIRYVYGLEPLADDVRCVVLAVPDDGLPDVAYALSGLGPTPAGCAAFHLSGSLGTEVLEPLHHAGFGVGSFHPLVAFSDPSRGPSRMAEAWVAVTAAPEPYRVAQELAYAVGSEVFAVPAFRRPLFHAATSMIAGVLEPLVTHSSNLLEQAGIESDDATHALVALVRSSLDRLEEGAAGAGLGGEPTDAETVALHLRALDPQDAVTYAVFAREALRLAEAEGRLAEPASREAIERELERVLQSEPSGAGAGH